MKPIKLILTIILRIVLITLALILFFSMMAGMYYKSAPTKIRVGIVDQDQSPLSRSIIYNIKKSQYFDVTNQAYDYLNLQHLVDDGSVDVGVVIPGHAYKDVLNKRSVSLLTVLNGTANPIVPKISLMMLNKIIMTLNIQMGMRMRVEELGSMPNTRHPKTPLLKINERVFYSPGLSMESSMLPAFMGLAMQIVSMLIVLFALMANLKIIRQKAPYIRLPRQLPLKALIPPFIISWVIVSTAISTAFFATMYLFKVPFDHHTMWEVSFIISLLVLAMESLSYFLALNIKNGAVLAGLITLIVMPAFMYSGYLVPIEQMAAIPNKIGNAFPLRHYLQALYPVFNHHQPLTSVYHHLNILWMYIGAFLILSALSIGVGQIERIYRRKKLIKENAKSQMEENKS